MHPPLVSRERRKTLFDLQQALDEIPHRGCYLLLSDLNTWIGSRTAPDDDDQWVSVLGPHWLGEANDAVKELLAFLSQSKATIYNTWFMKKKINQQTEI